MLGEDTIRSLKRSKSDVEDLVPMGERTPPRDSASSTPRNRSSRAFSITRLTEGFRRKGRSSFSRSNSSIDKETISSPIADSRSPLCPPTSTDSLAASPSPLVSARSSPSPRKLLVATRPAAKHTYSVSDPTNNHSPPTRPRLATHVPPPLLPTASSFGSADTVVGSPLERIAETPFDCDHDSEHLDLDRLGRQLAKMETIRASLLPPAMTTGTKARAIQQAKEMEALVAERAKRSGDEPPQYDFYELIGKGAYGRVFKGKSRNTGGLVAIKIIDIDTVDYQEMTTKNLSETLKEIDILQQLRDSKARPYVNIIEEAKAVHNELWIISEYASGGSVATLMKPMAMLKNPGPGLPEKFIIPIARELALGLKYIHEAGVLHRDMKANNVLILEDGRVQLCDFGVSGTLEPQKSKRTTIVGTPFWMAPELQREWIKDADPHSLAKPREILYGSEVDIWAYGCTVYEMACGFPPHHRSAPFDLPNAGVPLLEGERYSDELKDFLSFVLQPDPQDRPTPDEILEHVYLKDTTKMYPTVILVKLVEDYYLWEQQGGARQSLFNVFGAQAPDPLAPENEDEDDDDWTFSTSDEFEQEHLPQFSDPFVGGDARQSYTGMGLPPVADMGRFEQLQARFKEESITRGQRRLNKLFDTETTPYRYSMIDEDDDGGKGRPPSDLVLRDFNPGAPNRETVIDLDFSLPSTDDMPSIDLGEVPTIKANRMKSLLREMEEEDAREIAREKEEREQREFEEENQLTKRATRDWTFPSAPDNRKTQEWTFPSMEAPAEEPDNRKTLDWSFPAAEPPNRKTMEWSFPAAEPPKPNRKTVEWTFDAAMAEANYDAPRNRTSRRRETKEYIFPAATAPIDENRSTMDFSFPMRSPSPKRTRDGSGTVLDYPSQPTLGPGFRPSLRHAATEPPSDDFPRVSSDPNSPLRSSMIDLDMASVEDYRPSTSGSESTYTGSIYTASDNPFNLEDQVQLSQNNHRASFHMKSQSEPNHAVQGLLTPQQYDEQGLPTTQDPHHPSMHARGVSSVSQMQAHPKPPATSIPPLAAHRPNQRSQQTWDGWSHTHAYGLGSDDQSPAMSVTTDTSLEEEDVDELWDTFERLTLQAQRKYQSYAPLRSSRRTESRDDMLDPRAAGLGLGVGSDTDDNYPYTSDSSSPPYAFHRHSRVSAGPNGRPLVEFPIPRGPDVEALLGVESDPRVMQDVLLKSAMELRDGTRASRDLLRAMRLSEVEEAGAAAADDVDHSTVRLPSRGRE
ncbi:ATP binding [Ascochyta rabiei]|uniref:non-specific serine/threonine protein kinase n=1 Tax=Didymella rabiei TaxID=5454 RepID=A0A163C3M7_DIDRA|nr:ATP binding [Ascochyta rabiei]